MIIIFISVISVFIFLANWAVYAAIVSVFSITHPLWLGVSLGILSGSFILATILGHKFYNRFTRVYYTISAVWMGFFCYAFLVSGIHGVTLLLPFSQRVTTLIGERFFIVAFLIGLYGIFHARKITISNIHLTLPSLPAVWKNRSAVWISDLHLGQLHSPAFAQKVVNNINSLAPDIIFIGGDLFDGTTAPDSATLIAPLRELSPSLGIYYVTGNHEEFEKSDSFIAAIKSIGIKILEGENIDIDGLKIIGIGHGHGSKKEEFAKVLSTLSIDPKKPSILLKHEPRDLDIAAAAGISFQISGHTHRAQMWPLGYIAKLVYKDYDYGLKKYGAMQVYTSSGVGTWGPPQRVATNSEIVRITF
jgi:hypothetical protein